MNSRALRKNAAVIFCLWAGASLSSPVQTFSTLTNFDGADGAIPAFVSLVQGTNGTLYGTTEVGGASPNCTNGCGVIFEVTPAGKVTTLHRFSSTDGAYPYAGIVQGLDGSFYGTTEEGGANNLGTIFKITTAGKLTVLHSFGGPDGANPESALVLGFDGNLYGTVYAGGANHICSGGSSGCGSIFKITPDGVFTTLYSFDYNDGGGPTGALVQATNGNFYGTTNYGGAFGWGMVFEITPVGTLTVLHSFNQKDGAFPNAPFIQGIDGNLYGTTSGGGISGTVFAITPSGTLTTLYEFTGGSDGGTPDAGLFQGTDGNFYGTTAYFPLNSLGPCGFYGCGTVFKITSTGTLTTLHNFSETDGENPNGGLVQATNGTFYGTTTHGGADSDGTIFALSAGLAPFVTVTPSSGPPGTAVRILGTNLSGGATVSFNGTQAAFTVVSPSLMTTRVPTGATTGEVIVMTTGGSLLSNLPFRVTP
jgi:uncharacterized repeat protein (TIGR03803 family)